MPTPTPPPTLTPLPTLTVQPSPTLPPTSTGSLDAARKGSIKKDITYCTVNGFALKMDIYFPPQASAPWPVVIYVHGGTWTSGDKDHIQTFRDSTGMKDDSFLYVSINYRLAPKYKFPAQIQDLKCAVRYLRAHAAEYNLNPNKIGAWGSSAGAHLVSLLGTADASAGWDVGEYLDQSSQVQAVVDMFGPSDLTRIFQVKDKQIQKIVFGTFDPQNPIWVAASPVTYVSPDDPPFLILQGDKDQTVPLEQSQIFFDKLQAAGVISELVIVKNADHGFARVGNTPISPSPQEIGQKIEAFFNTYLK